MFAGKVVLITGASSGIGAATAIHFAKEGAQLSLTGRDRHNLEEVGKQCTINNSKPLLTVGDLSKEEDIATIFENTIKTYKKLDILINNAGIMELGTIETASLDQFDRILNVNIRAVYNLTKLATPYLIKTKGNIINVSSIAGVRAFTGVLNYCISKAALDQFTKCVALDLAPKGVRVNSVNPGFITTNLRKNFGLTDKEHEQMKQKASSIHPLGRVGTPEEVAQSIAFLASDQASFITGTLLPIDSGRNISCPR